MLAVDVGNTSTRIAAFAGGAVRGRRSFPTRDLAVAELLPAFFELGALADTPAAWIASVVPGANAVLDSAAEKAGLARRFLRPGRDDIMPHRLKTPQTTGVDRLLSAMAAGRLHFPGDRGAGGYIVIQCGSAATVDLVDGAGFFLGGYILPGPALWLAGLAGAAQLPDLSAGPPDWEAAEPGDNTRDAIAHGLAAGLPAAVAAAARRAGSGLPIAVTGGWGAAAARALTNECTLDPDLLLHGIRLFAEGSA